MSRFPAFNLVFRKDLDDSDEETRTKRGPRETATSKWTLNNKSANEKKVKDFVGQLNIQTDNLCQFLPQDKVHDFSKMDSKQLLVKTVEAVGDVELRKDHERLQSFQSNQGKSEAELQKNEVNKLTYTYRY